MLLFSVCILHFGKGSFLQIALFIALKMFICFVCWLAIKHKFAMNGSCFDWAAVCQPHPETVHFTISHWLRINLQTKRVPWSCEILLFVAQKMLSNSVTPQSLFVLIVLVKDQSFTLWILKVGDNIPGWMSHMPLVSDLFPFFFNC